MGSEEGERVRDVRGPGRQKSWAWGAPLVAGGEREGTSMTHRCPVGDTDAERKRREEPGPGGGQCLPSVTVPSRGEPLSSPPDLLRDGLKVLVQVDLCSSLNTLSIT